jgi:hypothetical protein
MQGATIAAALRKRREKAKKEHDEKIDALINEKSAQVLARIGDFVHTSSSYHIIRIRRAVSTPIRGASDCCPRAFGCPVAWASLCLDPSLLCPLVTDLDPSCFRPPSSTTSEKIDDILVDSEESKLFGLNSGQSNHAKVDAATLVKQVEGLIAVVEEKIERSSSYRYER